MKWDLVIYKVLTTATLPIVDIMTLAATGSEYDAGGVISRTETNDKVGYVSPYLFLVASFLDPICIKETDSSRLCRCYESYN